MDYIIDKKGKKTSVVLPLKEYEKLQANTIHLKKQLGLLLGIKRGMEEIRKSKKTGKPLRDVSALIKELENAN